MTELPPIDDVYFTSRLRALSTRDARYRDEVARGTLLRIHRGAFVSPSVWDPLTPEEKYQLRCIAAVHASRSSPILSHESAGAMHGVPSLKAYPTLVHVLATESAGSRTEHGFRKHASRFLAHDVVTRGDLRMTSFDRTLVDLAVTASFATAIAAFDWALRDGPDSGKPTTSIPRLVECADRLALGRTRGRFDRVLAFADARAESPGESLSRVVIHELGFPAPELQRTFSDQRGFIGRTDFWWPEQNLVGEFDGVAKYIRIEYSRGRSAADLVIAEKVREDRIRGLGPRFTRWGWAAASNPQELFTQLRSAGLPTTRRSVPRVRPPASGRAGSR